MTDYRDTTTLYSFPRNVGQRPFWNVARNEQGNYALVPPGAPATVAELPVRCRHSRQHLDMDRSPWQWICLDCGEPVLDQEAR